MADAGANLRHFGPAWLALCFAFCSHVADEALTGFLGVYNPTVLVLRARFAGFPMPTFEYREWLTGLLISNFVLLLLTPLVFRNARGLRPLAYLFAAIMFLNGMGHTFFSILGHTVTSIHFSRPAPGFYSSPFLLAASIYLFITLRKSARSR